MYHGTLHKTVSITSHQFPFHVSLYKTSMVRFAALSRPLLSCFQNMHWRPDIFLNLAAGAVCENANVAPDILQNFSCQSPGEISVWAHVRIQHDNLQKIHGQQVGPGATPRLNVKEMLRLLWVGRCPAAFLICELPTLQGFSDVASFSNLYEKSKNQVIIHSDYSSASQDSILNTEYMCSDRRSAKGNKTTQEIHLISWRVLRKKTCWRLSFKSHFQLLISTISLPRISTPPYYLQDWGVMC